MVDTSRLMEIRQNGIDSVTAADVPILLKNFAEFINTDVDAQKLTKDLKLVAGVDIKGTEKGIFSISNGKAAYAKREIKGAQFTMFADIKTIVEVLTGQKDAAMAFFCTDLKIDGDLEKMIAFFEIAELAYEKLGLARMGEKLAIIDAKTMRRLTEIYNISAEKIDSNDITLFFNIFAAYANNNPDAKGILAEQKELRLQINLTDINKAFVIKIRDGELIWSDQKIDDPLLEFSITIQTAAEVLLGSGPASAFRSGKVIVSGNMQQAMVFQELFESFSELLPLSK